MSFFPLTVDIERRGEGPPVLRRPDVTFDRSTILVPYPPLEVERSTENPLGQKEFEFEGIDISPLPLLLLLFSLDNPKIPTLLVDVGGIFSTFDVWWYIFDQLEFEKSSEPVIIHTYPLN